MKKTFSGSAISITGGVGFTHKQIIYYPMPVTLRLCRATLNLKKIVRKKMV